MNIAFWSIVIFQLVLIGLQISHEIDWSWWFVMLPSITATSAIVAILWAIARHRGE